jgi:hypothetical protein
MVLQLNLAAAKLQSLNDPDDCELNLLNAMIGRLLKTADLVTNYPGYIEMPIECIRSIIERVNRAPFKIMQADSDGTDRWRIKCN